MARAADGTSWTRAASGASAPPATPPYYDDGSHDFQLRTLGWKADA
ncbi:hypothetical protein [Paludisphaera soli]|nr:hypothetical protein [Paludisphaera soli]